MVYGPNVVTSSSPISIKNNTGIHKPTKVVPVTFFVLVFLLLDNCFLFLCLCVSGRWHDTLQFLFQVKTLHKLHDVQQSLLVQQHFQGSELDINLLLGVVIGGCKVWTFLVCLRKQVLTSYPENDDKSYQTSHLTRNLRKHPLKLNIFTSLFIYGLYKLKVAV